MDSGLRIRRRTENGRSDTRIDGAWEMIDDRIGLNEGGETKATRVRDGVVVGQTQQAPAQTDQRAVMGLAV